MSATATATATATRTGPPGRWLTGHMAEFGADRLGFLERCAREYGDEVPIRLGPNRAWIVSHPDRIEDVLVTHNKSFKKHSGLSFFRYILGDGLLTSEGPQWLAQRRLMQPAFHAKQLARYIPVFVELTRAMLASWKPGEPRDLYREFAHLTLGIAARTLFAADTSADAEGVSATLRSIVADNDIRMRQLVPWPMWLPTPSNRRLKAAVAKLDAVLYAIIARRRADGGAGDDLLSTLLRATDEIDGRKMTDRQLRDEVMTLFLAGHGTSANALAWSWYLLAKHPAEAEKLHAEADAVLGDREPTAADLPRLVFANRVVSESMRLYPPAYLIGREALEPLDLGGLKLRRGDTVFMSQWVVHRDGRWFPEPERFDPERWAGDAAERLPKYAYFPFGGGPRVCIGNTFARTELPLVLAEIARHWRFTLADDRPVTPWAVVTLRPREGVHAVLTHR
jgi:cytochrome P450